MTPLITTNLSTRTQYLNRISSLRTERASWFEHWRDISTYIQPRAGRFFITDRNRGDKRHNNIYNSTGSWALRTLAAGMQAGMTSPARPWFRLATTDTDLMEYAPVKLWLDSVTKLMLAIFARSNTYRSLHSTYEELGAFGTAASLMVPDFDNVIHHHSLTAGEYMVSTDAKGRVCTLSREYEMTVGQMIDDFGYENLSESVKSLYANGTGLDKWVPVYHLIEPRKDRDPARRDNKNMPFKSVYFEAGGNENRLLRESGFKRFPGFAPRWDVKGGDIYGNSPGMEALGDVKQLQHEETRKSQAIDYMVKPPLAIPAALKDQPHSTLPGGAAYYDMSGANTSIKSMFDVRLDLSHLSAEISKIEQRIGRTFYADLFLMLAQDDRSGITAREIAERHEEKLIMLGPVLERLHSELHQQLIDNTFDEMIAAGIVPTPPPELHAQDLNVQFVSMLAQAQRAVGVQSVDRLLGTVGSIAIMQVNAGRNADALDKLDLDQIIDGYSEMLGTDPNFIVADDKVALIRDQRVQQQQQAQQAAAMQQAAETAKTASEAKTDGESALSQALGQFQGYSVPGVLP